MRYSHWAQLPKLHSFSASTTMGLLMSLPIAGGLSSIATSCIAGLAFCCTSTAGIYFAQYQRVWLMPSRSIYVLQVLQLQLFDRYSCWICRTCLLQSLGYTQPCLPGYVDHILAQFYSCLDHEDRLCCQAHWEMELRLHSNGLCRRQMLWGFICAFYLIRAVRNLKANWRQRSRFIESVLHWHYSTYFSALSSSESRIRGTNGQQYRMGTLLCPKKCMTILMDL